LTSELNYTKFEDMPNLAKAIRSHLVLIYDKETGENGSGVLVKIGDRIFVLTASHVLFKNIQINLGLPVYTSPTILNCWSNPKMDIGFIELKPFEVEVLKMDKCKPFVIGKKNKTTIKTSERSSVICGYPSQHRYKRDNIYSFTPVFLACRLLSEEKWPERLKEMGKTLENNIVIPFGKKHGGTFYDIRKKPLNQIEPQGLSGCGLWYYIPGDENVEKPRYALFGIQTSYFRHSQVLVGTVLEPLIQEIQDRYGFTININN